MKLRNLILTDFITEEKFRDVVKEACEDNPSLKDVSVGKYDVSFAEVKSLRFAAVVVSDHANGIGMVASAGFYREEKDSPFCSKCHGYGTVSTGITEAPTTLCEPCNGTGKESME